MTEKEKMLAGLPYLSRDPELIEMYHRARELMRAYNTLNSRNLAERERLLTELLGFKGPGVWIETPFLCDYGENLSIGANTFVNANCMLIDNNRIEIGENCLIAPYVQMYTASHPLKAEERIIHDEFGTRYLTSAQPIKVGNQVWVGGNTVIFPGVTIGDNVTIGSGSVVTKDLPSNVLAYGNPCQVIKEL
ncbi:MAG: sugar O-acetyltransferase [Bacteroidota bacterium]